MNDDHRCEYIKRADVERCSNTSGTDRFCELHVQAPSDDERFDVWWAEDPRRADQNHLKLSARIGWRGALELVSAEREEARRRESEHEDSCDWKGAWRGSLSALDRQAVALASAKNNIASLLAENDQMKRMLAEPSDSAVTTALLGREIAELKRENDHLRGDIAVELRATITEQSTLIESLRANLANKTALVGNLTGERDGLLERNSALAGLFRKVAAERAELGLKNAHLRRLLGGHTCYANAPSAQALSEAIEERDAAREALRRVWARGQSIVDIAKNGMKGESS